MVGAQALVADSEFDEVFAAIYELNGAELEVQDAAAVAEVYLVLPPSGRYFLLVGLQERFAAFSSPKEGTEITATLIPNVTVFEA